MQVPYVSYLEAYAAVFCPGLFLLKKGPRFTEGKVGNVNFSFNLKFSHCSSGFSLGWEIKHLQYTALRVNLALPSTSYTWT